MLTACGVSRRCWTGSRDIGANGGRFSGLVVFHVNWNTVLKVGKQAGGVVDVADGGVVLHCGAHVGVAEERLGLTGVQAAFGELGCDCGPQRLEGAVLDARGLAGTFERAGDVALRDRPAGPGREHQSVLVDEALTDPVDP